MKKVQETPAHDDANQPQSEAIQAKVQPIAVAETPARMVFERTKECGSCAAFLPAAHHGGQAQCRRHAPVPLFFGLGQNPLDPTRQVPIVQAWFPWTDAKGWCMEWMEKDPNAAPFDFATLGGKQ